MIVCCSLLEFNWSPSAQKMFYFILSSITDFHCAVRSFSIHNVDRSIRFKNTILKTETYVQHGFFIFSYYYFFIMLFCSHLLKFVLPSTSILPLEIKIYQYFLANQCLILFFFFSPFSHVLFQAVFEEQWWSLGMVGGEQSLAGRQHLSANLKPGGKTHNMTSTVRAKTQRNKEFCHVY